MPKLIMKALAGTFVAGALVGCVVTSAKWMAYVASDPDDINQVLMDSNDQVVHVSEQSDGTHITTYDSTGTIASDTTLTQTINDTNGQVDLSGNRLLFLGGTLAESTLINANDHSASAIDAAMLSGDLATRSIAGHAQIANHKLAVFGSHNNQGWVLFLDFDNNASELLEVSGSSAVNALFSNTNLVLSSSTSQGEEIITLDQDLNELGRFLKGDSNLSLIGDSNGRPTFFNSSNNNVAVTAPNGDAVWEFENSEFEHIKGQSVGPDGSTLLWGDNSKFNPLSSVAEDSAHFLLISADGELLYHYEGGEAMANITYKHVKQFDNGTAQVSFQGWSGELNGLIIGSNLATPFTVTRKVFHDFISTAGKKTTWMREPERVETYSQCGTFCVKLVKDVEGHCDNLDVFNIGSKSLVSVSQVCGAKNPDDSAAPDTVKVARY